MNNPAKLPFIFLLAMSIPSFSFGQIAYHDAISLTQYIDPETKTFYTDSTSINTVAGILKSYLPSQVGQDLNARNILLIYKTESEQNENYNPIIAAYIPDLSSVASAGNTVPSFGTIANKIGGLNVTKVADALAKFIVERAKEELNVAFFNNFKKDLEQVKGLKELFPQTYKVFSLIGEEIYNYSYFIQTLRGAFQKDLAGLLTNLSLFLQEEEFDPLFRNTMIQEVVVKTLPVVESALKNDSPAAIISNLAKADFNHEALFNVDNTFKALNIISKSLFAKQGGKGQWVSTEEILLLLNNSLSFDLYLGLLYQQVRPIRFRVQEGTFFNLTDILVTIKKESNALEAFRDLIQSYVSKAAEVDDYRKAISNEEEERSLADYYGYFQAGTGLLEEAVKIQRLALQDSSNIKTLEKGIETVKIIAAIGLDVKVKNYNSAVFNVVLLIEEITGKESSALKSILLKYGTFAANVAKAETSDEVKAAIEAVALPAGSASIKRHAKSNVSLNSYLGLFAGNEWIRDKSASENKFVFGLTAPVGVAFSWGQKSTIPILKGKGSQTIFLRVIDLGAIASFRFNDEETEVLPELTFQNILAPGVDYIYGFPNAPVSVGAGAQLGPALRKINSMSADISNSVNWRIHAFIAVDIPLLNFYTKTR